MHTHHRYKGARSAAAILAACIATAAPQALAAAPEPHAATAAGSPASPHVARKPATATDFAVCGPIGVAVDSNDELFVANHYGTSSCDYSSGQILVYSSGGIRRPQRTLTTGISNPAGIAFDAQGDLLDAEVNTQQVLFFSSRGKPLPQKTLHTDPAFNPSGVQVDSTGNVWVANRDNNDFSIGEIQIFKTDGTVTAITQGLVYPLGIVFQPGTGDAFVANAEYPNDALTVYSPTGAYLRTIATPGQTPTYDAFELNGELLYTNPFDNTVQEIDPTSGASLGSVSGSSLNGTYGIAVTSIGDFYVANFNANTVTKYDRNGVLMCTISGTSNCI